MPDTEHLAEGTIQPPLDPAVIAEEAISAVGVDQPYVVVEQIFARPDADVDTKAAAVTIAAEEVPGLDDRATKRTIVLIHMQNLHRKRRRGQLVISGYKRAALY